MNLFTTQNIFNSIVNELILNDKGTTVYHRPAWLKAVSEAIGQKGKLLSYLCW